MVMSLVSEMYEIIEQVVERYQVCWEVYPHEEMWNGTRIQTGFDVELYGTHCCNGQRPTPGCEHCLEVYDALQAIGLSILPEERRPSKYELSPFDQSIRYSHMRKDRPDVLLTITVSHRNHPMEWIDECEVRCLNEIKQKLRDIGAEQRTWNRQKAKELRKTETCELAYPDLGSLRGFHTAMPSRVS